MNTVKPLRDFVLLKRLDTRQYNAKEGVIVDESDNHVPTQAIVLDVGPKVPKFSVLIGDRVLFYRFKGLVFNFEGKEYILMKESEILGVLEDE